LTCSLTPLYKKTEISNIVNHAIEKGIIETSTLRALSLRVTHLESLVTKLVDESNAYSSAIRARRQMTISLVALGVTVALWVLWIVLSFID
jgi:hypothetical protein